MNSERNRPEQQHYVTRAYLEGFLAPASEQLYVYTRNKNSFFRGTPRKLARIHNYYSIKREDGTYDDQLEHTLQTAVEDPGLAVINRLKARHYSISAYARGQLSLLMAIQEFRVPWMRESMEAMYGGVIDKINRFVLSIPGLLEQRLEELSASDPEAKEVTAEQLRESYFGGKFQIEVGSQTSLWAMGQVAELLADCYYLMKWTVYETNSTFVTTECPVHRYYSRERPEIPFCGLADPRVEVHFPLSRQQMLVLRHDKTKMDRVTELMQQGRDREARKLRARASEISVLPASDEFTRDLNAHAISMAGRLVFSPVEDERIVELFRGECKNVRHEITQMPDGLIKVSAIYPDR